MKGPKTRLIRKNQEKEKVLNRYACLVSAGRSFHAFAPRHERHFCPLLDIFMGSLKSVSELRRTEEEHFEFRVKRSHKYWGASSSVV